METLLRRLLWCFGTRHREGKPRHRHDSPRGGTDGARRSFFRPTRRPSGAARFRRGANVEVRHEETPTLRRRRRWLRLRGMNRVLARSWSSPCGMTTGAMAIEPKPATTDAATVRLPSGARNGAGNQGFSFSRESTASATIQAHFRAHLARQAFRALRSLVKLQAFARGAYVRKQANVAIRFMKVLVRLQVRVRSRQLLLLRPRPAKGEQSNNR